MNHNTTARLGSRLIVGLVAGVSLCSAGTALAQLTPDRLYYGVNREVPMTIKVPDGKKGEVSVKLLEAGTAKELATASAAAGAVNLATLFPQMWADAKPAVVYAQLAVGEEKVGPAVVIQPLLSPASARPGQGGKFQFMESPRPIFSGVRAYVDQNVKIETSMGDLTIELRPDVAPNNAWNFRELAKGGFYTDIAIHRIANDNGMGQPFVIQAGDPNGNGLGGPGYNIDLEKSIALPHDFGVVSMARSPQGPDTAGSQFFVCLSREGTGFLDGGYTTFGQTIEGTETITKLASVETVVNNGKASDRPVNPPKIKSAKLVDAAPYGTGAKPVTRPGATPATPEKER
jgi:cyclophilin family peptidyl-prolyl cis-trans isomerase